MIDPSSLAVSGILEHLPDHSPSMWGWHKTDPNMVGDDLVSLQPYDAYIADPTLIVALMEQQGVTGVDSIEIDGQQSGGTSTNNYKAYIHWTDGTQTKVLIKGRRPHEFATASYRESLFYSRIAEGIQSYAKTADHYLAVADIETGDAIFIEQFMTGYISLQDVYSAYQQGTLDDLGIDPDTFDYTESQKSVMSFMANISASHWMDTSLDTEFWMKNYDEVQGHGRYDQDGQIAQVNLVWHRFKKAAEDPDSYPHLSDNTLACFQAIIDNWTYKAVIDEWALPTYKWGLTHGDFHAGQILVNPDDYLNDMIITDFEFAGIMGNPAIDLATWMISLPVSYLNDYEEELVQQYYSSLINAGIDMESYSFEQLWEDYQIYGSAQIVQRYLAVGGIAPNNLIMQAAFMTVQKFFDRHDLTPEKMKFPVYGSYDTFV